MEQVVVEDLWYTYPGGLEPALRGVNLRVSRGSFTLITGPSGCGKTTLCRCLNGLIPHFYGGILKGRVVVEGLEVASRPTHEVAKLVGMVFQEPEDQLIQLTVEREVAFGPENLGLPRSEVRDRVEEALTALRLSHLRDKAPFELSGGEQQKVALAAALALKPSVLVLDEPTSNLDPASAAEFIKLLVDLNREGLTVILVEHRLDLAARYSDQAVLMSEGRIVLMGPPEEVLASDEALRLGVAVPKAVELYRELSARGLRLPHPPLDPEELARGLVELLERRPR